MILETWRPLLEDWLPVVLGLLPLAFAFLAFVISAATLGRINKLKWRVSHLEALRLQDTALALLEPLPERCEKLRRGLTALGMRHGNPYSPERRAAEEECDALLARQLRLREQVIAASQGLEELRSKELGQRQDQLASLKAQTEQLIAEIQTREAARDSGLRTLGGQTS